MKALFERRPSSVYEVAGFAFVFAATLLLMLTAYAVYALHGTLEDYWLNITWGAGAGLAIMVVKDQHFQKQWLRLLRLRVPSVHVQRWVAGHFLRMMVWTGLWSLAVVWIARLSGYTLLEVSSLVGLSLLGFPLYGLADLAWMGYGHRYLRLLGCLAACSYYVWHFALLWPRWGVHQGPWLIVVTLVLALVGMLVLMQLMMRLGEPMNYVVRPIWPWRQKLANAVAYLRGQGRWLGTPWLAAVAIQPWAQIIFNPMNASIKAAPFLRLFGLFCLMLCVLRSDRHHWRWQLIPRLRARKAWAYEIWAASIRFVITLALPAIVLRLFFLQSRTGITWQDLLQTQGPLLWWWCVELALAAAVAVWVRTLSWKRRPDMFLLPLFVIFFIWGSIESGTHFWSPRHAGHDLLLLLTGFAFMVRANHNLRFYDLPDWGHQPQTVFNLHPQHRGGL